ncbi:MAG: DUF6671 family protein [Rhabdochlamydiaceae bacterium]
MGSCCLEKTSLYQNECILLATKHAKSAAIHPVFLQNLGAHVIEYLLDTDQFGTFSGEIQRKGTALECAREKCESLLNQFDSRVQFALASEGSFGPDPLLPFLTFNQEILYFIDRKRNIHVHVSHISYQTNYHGQEVSSLEELHKLFDRLKFPSHALIIRSSHKEWDGPVFKGLDTEKAIEHAFGECLKKSQNGKIWIETDMRALFNPSRMKVIEETALKLCETLTTYCPVCEAPGWKAITLERGLPCSDCGLKTNLVKSEIWGCPKCFFEEKKARSDGKEQASPANCHICNP